MASSKMMSSPTAASNSDLRPQFPFPVPPDLRSDHSASAALATAMDDFFKNIYSDSSHISPATGNGAGDVPTRSVAGNNGMDEVWKDAEVTLEDFLTRATDSVREDAIRSPAIPSLPSLPPPPPPPSQCFGETANAGNSMIDGGGVGVGIVGVPVGHDQFQSSLRAEGYGNGGGGRTKKRRAMVEPAVDKATQQRQKRMIKNRESAARSRERKQAYTVELESMVAQLEEENSRLQNEEAQETRERLKQLMENVIPVTEKQRPRRALRRINSLGCHRHLWTHIHERLDHSKPGHSRKIQIRELLVPGRPVPRSAVETPERRPL